MKKLFLISMVALFSFFLVIGCTSNVDEKTEESTGVIKGKVLYSNESISDYSGIKVYLEKLESSNRSAVVSRSQLEGSVVSTVYYKETTTDIDGNYEFTELPNGSYTIYAFDANGDTVAIKSTTVVNGGTVEIEDLKLVLKGSISGTIKLSSDSEVSIAGAIVGIAGTSYIAFVAEDGSFTISGVPAGTYKLCLMINNVYTSFDTEYTIDGKSTSDAGTLSVSIPSDSSDDDNEEDNRISYVSAKATDKGIEFSGSILSNISSSNSSESAVATIKITDVENNITMQQNFTKESYYFTEWDYIYPLVEANKEYSFYVKVSYQDYVMYQENFSVTAIGGLGELKIENSDECTVELTEDRVMQKKSEPEFTQNSNVNILRQGTWYQIFKTNSDKEWEGYVIDGTRWNDTSDGTYPLKDIKNICGWKTFKLANAQLSGNDYLLEGRTCLKIAGFTYDNTIFWMNDYSIVYGEWGGEKVKTLVVYGISGLGDSDVFTSSEFKTLENNYFTVKNLPGSEHTITIDETETTYAYSELVDFASTIYEPTSIPTALYKGSSYDDIYFSKWDRTFPSEAYQNTFGTIDGEETCIVKITAQFEAVQPIYTVTYKLNYGSDDVYTTQIVCPDNTKYDWWLAYAFYFPEEDPTREGYYFTGWYTDSDCKNKFSEGTVIDSDTTLYAGWSTTPIENTSEEINTSEETSTTVDYGTILASYTGSDLQTFLGGLGTLNDDGDVVITPAGWGTSATLGTEYKVADISSIVVNAKVTDSGYQAFIQFYEIDADEKWITVNTTTTSTDFTDLSFTDFGDLTTIYGIQIVAQSTSTWSALEDSDVVIHSITFYVK